MGEDSLLRQRARRWEERDPVLRGQQRARMTSDSGDIKDFGHCPSGIKPQSIFGKTPASHPDERLETRE